MVSVVGADVVAVVVGSGVVGAGVVAVVVGVGCGVAGVVSVGVAVAVGIKKPMTRTPIESFSETNKK